MLDKYLSINFFLKNYFIYNIIQLNYIHLQKDDGS